MTTMTTMTARPTMKLETPDCITEDEETLITYEISMTQEALRKAGEVPARDIWRELARAEAQLNRLKERIFGIVERFKDHSDD